MCTITSLHLKTRIDSKHGATPVRVPRLFVYDQQHRGTSDPAGMAGRTRHARYRAGQFRPAVRTASRPGSVAGQPAGPQQFTGGNPSLSPHPELEAVDRDLVWAEQNDNHILRLNTAEYPELLRQISDPPPLLYVHGSIEALHTPQLAMVGSRNPSAGGQETARAFAAHLSGVGLTITSGLALVSTPPVMLVPMTAAA